MYIIYIELNEIEIYSSYMKITSSRAYITQMVSQSRFQNKSVQTHLTSRNSQRAQP